MATKKKTKTKAQLEQEIKELKAGMIVNYACAYREIDKLSTDHCMGSGIVLELTAIGGRRSTEPILIRDGLSKATIDAIKADIIRSQNESLMFAIKDPNNASND